MLDSTPRQKKGRRHQKRGQQKGRQQPSTPTHPPPHPTPVTTQTTQTTPKKTAAETQKQYRVNKIQELGYDEYRRRENSRLKKYRVRIYV